MRQRASGSKRAAAALRGLFASGLDAPGDRRARIWIERGLACLSALLAVTTLLWRDWIEIVFRVGADGGSGALEWAIVTACLAMGVAFGALARRDARRSLVSLTDR